MAKKGASNRNANIATRDEAVRQQTVRDGTQQINNTFGQFDDAFFDKQRQNYLNFALPQLDDQYGKAQRDLTFSLARDGNLNSSAQAYQNGQLQKAYDTNRTTIADQGQTYANQARGNVEDARANLITTLNATGDASGAANSALARSAALSQPVGYSAIGDAFGAITGGLASQAQLNRAQALATGKPITAATLFGTSGAVRNSG
ncbi:hypothetical protein MKK55_15220 [Methylobacterium sp. J-059]|uniref:hypothetical protein n=1 Tax=Methylobacterium sp. J-059 TaxID=2836643 RepID=UPI001FB92BBA|nr:hypothetical protein [Methylobacterium sp. J-059]MCJ2040282.1 hypothetical protein [Methylobacterium sp. J-059]